MKIELTSKLDEAKWTWRAAGAKQPKGVLDASILYEGAKAGDVVSAEADFEMDGITITLVSRPQKKRQDAQTRVAVMGTSEEREFKAVTSELVSKGRRGHPERGHSRGEAGRGEKPTRGEPDRNRSRIERGDKPHGPRDRDAARPRTERSDRSAAARTDPARGDAASGGQRQQRGGKSERPGGGRPGRTVPAVPAFKKLVPKAVQRKAILDELPAEHRPIAEQVLRGGIPAMRQAIEAQNTIARQEGQPEINGAALILVAETLLPRLKTAEWLDRAEAAKAAVDEISVRDLRAVVTSFDTVARTEQTRELASDLRQALERRSAEASTVWLSEIGTCLDEGRVVRALRLSSRPPDSQVKFPPELLERLKQGAEEAMSPDTPADRWITLLDAVSNSPIRRTVEPSGLPAEPGEALLAAAQQAVSRIPALGRQMGISIPPPPTKPARPPRPPAPVTQQAQVSQGIVAQDQPDADVGTPETGRPENGSEGPMHDDHSGDET